MEISPLWKCLEHAETQASSATGLQLFLYTATALLANLITVGQLHHSHKPLLPKLQVSGTSALGTLIPQYWRSPSSSYTVMGPFCAAATFPSVCILDCTGEGLVPGSVCEGEPFCHIQILCFQGVLLVYTSQFWKGHCSPNRSAAFYQILWHLFCSLISLLFMFSLMFCYVTWENVSCSQLPFCSSRFHSTCILAKTSAFQLSYLGPNLIRCLHHHWKTSYPFLKI